MAAPLNTRSTRINSICTLPFILLASLLISLSGCARESKEELILSVSDAEAEQFAEELLDDVTLDVADDLEVSLWASEELLSDPVGINFDNHGRAWIATTTRRRTSVPDAGAVSQWFHDNLSWRSVEDRRDFLRHELTPENSDENIWLPDFNEDGIHDLRDLVIERDTVHLLEDLTGNGYANQAKMMDWDLYDEVSEFSGAILYHEGDIFLGIAPDMWRISDSNGDGTWDAPESISHGYGVHYGFSGHGMSGLKVGPDGRIYWTIGDIGLNIEGDEGEHWYYPDEGAIMRSEPDGSNFEVFATGVRNIHEFDFDKYGNLVAVDNDGPSGDADRLVYLVDGSDSGWRNYWQIGKYTDPKNNDYSVWLNEGTNLPYFDDQPAHILPPLAPSYRGPAGMVYNPGTALNDEWKDHFFSASFVGSTTQSGINAFTLEENGASYQLDTSRVVLKGFLSTSLDFGTDGALYSTDWIEGWATKGTGRVWQIDTQDDEGSSIRTETKNLLMEDFVDRPSEELLDLLNHEDMRVRKKAQFEIVERGDTQYFIEALEQTEHQLGRIHGIWGLAQAGRRNPEVVKPLIDYLNDADPEIRAQAAKMLGDVRYGPAAGSLIPLLQDEHSRVRFFAAEALGRMAYKPAIEPITEMLRTNNDEDAYLRNAGFIALERIGDTEALAELSAHPSRSVRIAALVALRRLNSPDVALFLDDEDELIVTEAARAINDEEFLEEELPHLAQMLDQKRVMNEPLLRRAVNANLYGGTQEDAARLANFTVREDVSEDLKVEALNTLKSWPESSDLDRVTGMYRGTVRNNPAVARQALEPVLTQILTEGSSAIKMAGVRLAGTLKSTTAYPEILGLINNDPSVDVRIASLNSLLDADYDQMEEVISAALNDEEQAVRMNALSHIPNLTLPAEATVALLEDVLKSGTVEERQVALNTLGKIEEQASYAALNHQMDLMINEDLAQEVQLDLVLAVEAVNSEPLHARLHKYQSEKPNEDYEVKYVESLYGGNSEEGERIFMDHADAQCFRCHTDGGGAGPDLTLAGRSLTREHVLESLIDPSAEISPGYGTVSLTLQNGETIRGILSGETESRIIVSQGNQEQEIDKSDISERVNSPSAMPAMGDILTRSELRDLVEYLSTK
ncbi:MAG: HEAT repeat domain-containing protein [Balneolales bacterium]